MTHELGITLDCKWFNHMDTDRSFKVPYSELICKHTSIGRHISMRDLVRIVACQTIEVYGPSAKRHNAAIPKRLNWPSIDAKIVDDSIYIGRRILPREVVYDIWVSTHFLYSNIGFHIWRGVISSNMRQPWHDCKNVTVPQLVPQTSAFRSKA